MSRSLGRVLELHEELNARQERAEKRRSSRSRAIAKDRPIAKNIYRCGPRCGPPWHPIPRPWEVREKLVVCDPCPDKGSVGPTSKGPSSDPGADHDRARVPPCQEQTTTDPEPPQQTTIDPEPPQQTTIDPEPLQQTSRRQTSGAKIDPGMRSSLESTTASLVSIPDSSPGLVLPAPDPSSGLWSRYCNITTSRANSIGIDRNRSRGRTPPPRSTTQASTAFARSSLAVSARSSLAGANTNRLRNSLDMGVDLGRGDSL